MIDCDHAPQHAGRGARRACPACTRSPTSPASASPATCSRSAAARSSAREVRFDALPVIAEALRLGEAGLRHRRLGAQLGGLRRRRRRCPRRTPTGSSKLLTDPQTSGGLLVACAPEAVHGGAGGLPAAGLRRRARDRQARTPEPSRALQRLRVQKRLQRRPHPLQHQRLRRSVGWMRSGWKVLRACRRNPRAGTAPARAGALRELADRPLRTRSV